MIVDDCLMIVAIVEDVPGDQVHDDQHDFLMMLVFTTTYYYDS